ncbi:MAG: hypothetical protein LBE92_02895 [Chryseobacterium sp.]|uniref:hypothetical protein n=1 Tax=Chryseobacterium sp. TaxID=1871047 RepID=UPI0028190916|nr:hypothetical protein [Chryseobacterium sp.]MDR2235046.1 hypothetical protein [Chryseobacterium sp.]
MSWRRMNPDEPETVYTSNATELPQLAADIKTVVDRIIENREADNATEAEQLLFYINATNGYIRILWINDTDALGTWAYHLDLPELHEGGDAIIFDQLCYNALWDYTEQNNFDEEYNLIYRVFYRTELTDVEELLI